MELTPAFFEPLSKKPPILTTRATICLPNKIDGSPQSPRPPELASEPPDAGAIPAGPSGNSTHLRKLNPLPSHPRPLPRKWAMR